MLPREFKRKWRCPKLKEGVDEDQEVDIGNEYALLMATYEAVISGMELPC
jgi:hypothetical protein